MTTLISCVLLVPIEFGADINNLLADWGFGPGNLGVHLEKANGAKWIGCHTWCDQDFIDQLMDPANNSPATDVLVISAVLGGDATDNWEQTLLTNGLTISIPENPPMV